MRIGHGYDAHRFCEDKRLVIGGVEIEYELGLLAHSDGDVLLHALMDALLGALALGDIGMIFPDTDERYRGADSMELLKHVLSMAEFADWNICNVDLCIIAQAPKLSPYREEMRKSLAAVLGLGTDRVSVKFTTTEKLGFTGRKEGIASQAAVLLCRKN